MKDKIQCQQKSEDKMRYYETHLWERWIRENLIQIRKCARCGFNKLQILI